MMMRIEVLKTCVQSPSVKNPPILAHRGYSFEGRENRKEDHSGSDAVLERVMNHLAKALNWAANPFLEKPLKNFRFFKIFLITWYILGNGFLSPFSNNKFYFF
jgi:hypothetical protein